jgi:hypothetical protein
VLLHVLSLHVRYPGCGQSNSDSWSPGSLRNGHEPSIAILLRGDEVLQPSPCGLPLVVVKPPRMQRSFMI